MTRSKSKPRSRKKPERQTATFREHWNFFSVPYLWWSLVVMIGCSLINFLVHRHTSTYTSNALIAFPAIPCFLIVFIFFRKRIDVCTFEQSRFSNFPLVIGVFGLILPNSFLQKMIIDFAQGRAVGSDIPGWPVTLPEDAMDKPLWWFVGFLSSQVLFMIFTQIPVMYRKDLYQYLGREAENGKL